MTSGEGRRLSRLPVGLMGGRCSRLALSALVSGWRLRWLPAVLAATTLAACGGSPADTAAERAAQSRAYATAVTQVTTRTSNRLAEISAQADYRDAASAAQSTRDYAASIGTAAAELARARPPATVVAQHQELTALYGTTADHMDILAEGFAALTGKRAIAQQAQKLSAEVQRYSTRETQLRSNIEKRLAKLTTPQ